MPYPYNQVAKDFGRCLDAAREKANKHTPMVKDWSSYESTEIIDRWVATPLHKDVKPPEDPKQTTGGNGMIEVTTVNGYRKMLNVKYIVSINELRNNGKSNTAIVMSNNETVFADDKYDRVNDMYMQAIQINQEMGN